MKINYLTILGVIGSLIIGYFLSDYQNKKNNKRLIAAFKAELEAYNKAKVRATPTEKIAIEQQQQILESNINLLESL